MKKVGKKTVFWQFCSAIWNLFFERIELPKNCEIQSEFCDNYHLTPAHTRRRSTIRVEDWWYALRVAVACTECHDWADQRERSDTEAIIEAVIINRFGSMGWTEADIRRVLLECAAEIQAKNEKYQHFEVIL